MTEEDKSKVHVFADLEYRGKASPQLFADENTVGGYKLENSENFLVLLTKKPSWIRRFMMKICFGIIWEDNDNI